VYEQITHSSFLTANNTNTVTHKYLHSLILPNTHVNFYKAVSQKPNCLGPWSYELFLHVLTKKNSLLIFSQNYETLCTSHSNRIYLQKKLDSQQLLITVVSYRAMGIINQVFKPNFIQVHSPLVKFTTSSSSLLSSPPPPLHITSHHIEGRNQLWN
jgi:hypothetical protein